MILKESHKKNFRHADNKRLDNMKELILERTSGHEKAFLAGKNYESTHTGQTE
jgi:hypothetical protein